MATTYTDIVISNDIEDGDQVATVVWKHKSSTYVVPAGTHGYTTNWFGDDEVHYRTEFYVIFKLKYKNSKLWFQVTLRKYNVRADLDMGGFNNHFCICCKQTSGTIPSNDSSWDSFINSNSGKVLIHFDGARGDRYDLDETCIAYDYTVNTTYPAKTSNSPTTNMYVYHNSDVESGGWADFEQMFGYKPDADHQTIYLYGICGHSGCENDETAHKCGKIMAMSVPALNLYTAPSNLSPAIFTCTGTTIETGIGWDPGSEVDDERATLYLSPNNVSIGDYTYNSSTDKRKTQLSCGAHHTFTGLTKGVKYYLYARMTDDTTTLAKKCSESGTTWLLGLDSISLDTRSIKFSMYKKKGDHWNLHSTPYKWDIALLDNNSNIIDTTDVNSIVADNNIKIDNNENDITDENPTSSSNKVTRQKTRLYRLPHTFQGEDDPSNSYNAYKYMLRVWVVGMTDEDSHSDTVESYVFNVPELILKNTSVTPHQSSIQSTWQTKKKDEFGNESDYDVCDIAGNNITISSATYKADLDSGYCTPSDYSAKNFPNINYPNSKSLDTPTNLNYFTKYILTATATDGINTATASVVTHTTFPYARVYVNGAWKKAIPYIYCKDGNSYSWKPAAGFIYYNNGWHVFNGE